MAGGSLTVSVDNNGMGQAVAQRILCAVTLANQPFVRTDTARGPGISFIIPEERFPAGPSLVLKRGGTDLLSGYVAGTNISYYVTDGMSIETNVNTCPASTNQPTTTGASFVSGVGGNPLAVTLTYANAGGAGTVNIGWGDGTFTNGAAESGTANHTYPNNGLYRIAITDASSATDTATTVVSVP